MDIDGYDGSQLAPLETNIDTGALDNSLTANADQMFDITAVQEVKLNENENENQEINHQYIENMDMIKEDNNENIENIENMDNKNSEKNKGFMKTLGVIGIFIIIWIILGLIAFITSIVCFGFSGSTMEKVMGLLIALLFGPFYWLYFYLNKNYCGRKRTNSKSE